MSMKYLLLLVLFGSSLHYAHSQENSRGTLEDEKVSAFDLSEESSKKISKRQYKKSYRFQFYKHHDDLVDQFYDRIEDNKRKYKKMERQMKKPQYSDPSYFGHKRKPKIRQVGKRKFCTECGITH